jgi:hypothetical protein
MHMRTLVRHCLVLSLLALCLPGPHAMELHVANGIGSMPGTRKKIGTAEVLWRKVRSTLTKAQLGSPADGFDLVPTAANAPGFRHGTPSPGSVHRGSAHLPRLRAGRVPNHCP